MSLINYFQIKSIILNNTMHYHNPTNTLFTKFSNKNNGQNTTKFKYCLN